MCVLHVRKKCIPYVLHVRWNWLAYLSDFSDLTVCLQCICVVLVPILCSETIQDKQCATYVTHYCLTYWSDFSNSTVRWPTITRDSANNVHAVLILKYVCNKVNVLRTRLRLWQSEVLSLKYTCIVMKVLKTSATSGARANWSFLSMIK